MAEESKSAVIRGARKSIQDAIEHAEEDRRRKLLNQRLEIARTGVALYRKGKHGEAVKAFNTYLHILEDIKGCKSGELHPSQFHKTQDLQELLLISGIYWDMVKLYDRTASGKARKEFLHYLEKYILFARGMPYQVLCAETLRKYIANDKPVHPRDFKNAYKLLANTRCFIATSLVDLVEEPTIPALWRLRDEHLVHSTAGRAFVRAYYAVGPSIAWILDRAPDRIREGVAKFLDTLARD